MPSRIIRTPGDLDSLMLFLSLQRLPLTVSYIRGRDRSAEQNALMWKWASEVAYQREDVAPEDVQAEWKLHHGVPILRADDPEFCAEYDALFKALPYETKLRLIRLMDWPVTRRMKVAQMTRFLDTVQRECVGMGLQLTIPEAA
jgi:hypothetical protein